MSNPLIQILDRTGKNKNVPLEPQAVSAEASAPLDLAAVRAKLAQKNGRAYWRSLEELAGDDEFNHFLEREFPRQAPRDMAPLARRDFLKLMGASLALAGGFRLRVSAVRAGRGLRERSRRHDSRRAAILRDGDDDGRLRHRTFGRKQYGSPDQNRRQSFASLKFGRDRYFRAGFDFKFV